MRWPFVSRFAYDMALKVAEGAQRHAENMEHLAARETKKADALQAKVWELADRLVSMKKENFVEDVPVTHAALSVDEADEFAAEEDATARQGMLKRKFG
jgi:hypothetical protein